MSFCDSAATPPLWPPWPRPRPGSAISLREHCGARADSRRSCTRSRPFRLVFPHKNLERQIEGDTWRGQHHRRARLGAAEDQQFRGRHRHAHLRCLAAVIDSANSVTPFAARIPRSRATVSSTECRDSPHRRFHGRLPPYAPPLFSGQIENLHTEKYKIDRHRQPNDGEKECQCHRLRRGMAARDLSAVQLAHHAR